MKFLYVTTISNTMGFFVEHIKMLYNEGHIVEIACAQGTKPLNPVYEQLGCKVHLIPFSRSPFSLNNLKAYKMLKKLVESEHYDVVHTHTPNASMIARLACRRVRKQGSKVVYTAHGFHFFKGAPLKNWLMYYPVEKFCAKYTDVLITINQEDYEFAQRKIHAKKVCYVPGVGIDLDKIRDVKCDRSEIRKSIGLPDDSILLLSVGELSVRKNHQVVIRALALLNNKKIHYAIAGEGALKDNLINLSKQLGVESQVHLLGRRNDVFALNKSADISILPSFHEGLPVAMMEAMACGLPILCSKIRGNVDLIEDGKGGYFFSPADANELSLLLNKMINECDCWPKMKVWNSGTIERFDVKKIVKEMRNVLL